MNVPQFLKEAKSGDFLTTKYGCIICVQRVEISEKGVRVYFYFDYDPKENLFMMNEWLYGFYGPKFDDDKFYRPSTTEEKVLMIDMMAKYGYELKDYYNEMTPCLNRNGFERIKKVSEKGE